MVVIKHQVVDWWVEFMWWPCLKAPGWQRSWKWWFCCHRCFTEELWNLWKWISISRGAVVTNRRTITSDHDILELVAVHKTSRPGVVQTFHNLLFISPWDRCKVEQDWMYVCMYLYMHAFCICTDLSAFYHPQRKQIEMLGQKGPFPWRRMSKGYGPQTKRNLSSYRSLLQYTVYYFLCTNYCNLTWLVSMLSQKNAAKMN